MRKIILFLLLLIDSGNAETLGFRIVEAFYKRDGQEFRLYSVRTNPPDGTISSRQSSILHEVESPTDRLSNKEPFRWSLPNYLLWIKTGIEAEKKARWILNTVKAFAIRAEIKRGTLLRGSLLHQRMIAEDINDGRSSAVLITKVVGENEIPIASLRTKHALPEDDFLTILGHRFNRDEVFLGSYIHARSETLKVTRLLGDFAEATGVTQFGRALTEQEKQINWSQTFEFRDFLIPERYLFWATQRPTRIYHMMGAEEQLIKDSALGIEFWSWSRKSYLENLGRIRSEKIHSWVNTSPPRQRRVLYSGRPSCPATVKGIYSPN